ncbi:hypothetical protein BU23DRAFT_558812 [Bimuria novae-zelandiae CBS 107.79]|uniref:Uncharacterized protein n=1 Tax=Bimuria novae-zelandiae CBS 107.79 TaxID=1447943 RepID=A0A6A5UUP3_9PLEO|nr:hypothetical protein BU23DRAFT_558812 [Bimuria novae-zelandiae CBS 107.79]
MAHLRRLREQSARKHQQIQDLQEEERRLNLQFEEQFLQHTQADCKQLVNMMHEKLPQELKELVYQYLYIEEAPVPIGLGHFTTYVPEALRSQHSNAPTQREPFIVVPEGANRQDHSVERDRNILYPDSWLLDPTYLGHTIAQDASKFYYKSNTFSICTLENALSDFLFRDPIHNFIRPQQGAETNRPVGLLPIDYIRNLQIRIKYEHYWTYLTFYDTLHDGEKNLLLGIFGTLRQFTNSVDPAIASQLQLEFCIMTAYTVAEFDSLRTSITHINLLEAIRVPVYTLKHDFDANITVTHYDENISPFPKNVTGIFQLSKEQWLQEKEAHQDAAREYSPLHFRINWSGRREEGFGSFEYGRLIQGRWGFASALDVSCTKPIEEGEYWPLGETRPMEGAIFGRARSSPTSP